LNTVIACTLPFVPPTHLLDPVDGLNAAKLPPLPAPAA